MTVRTVQREPKYRRPAVLPAVLDTEIGGKESKTIDSGPFMISLFISAVLAIESYQIILSTRLGNKYPTKMGHSPLQKQNYY